GWITSFLRKMEFTFHHRLLTICCSVLREQFLKNSNKFEGKEKRVDQGSECASTGAYNST
ncbi:hypothetical protein CHH62_23980, partial [Niallia circulans]